LTIGDAIKFLEKNASNLGYGCLAPDIAANLPAAARAHDFSFASPAVVANQVKHKDLERVVVDTTIQEKAIAHPTDARLISRAIEKLVDLANESNSKCLVGKLFNANRR
jgi:hypothetical protein